MPCLMGCSCTKGVKEYIDDYTNNVILNKSNSNEYQAVELTEIPQNYQYIAMALLSVRLIVFTFKVKKVKIMPNTMF